MTLLPDVTSRVCAWLDRQGTDDGPHATGLDGLLVLRHRNPSPIEATLYTPLLCLILQGRKDTISGDRRVSFGPGELLIVSHDLPVLSRVTEATDATPYVALILILDVGLLHSLYAEVGDTLTSGPAVHALEAGPADRALIDAVGRLFDLVDLPTEAAVLGPLVRREIHFRLLLAQHGNTLRQLLRGGSHAQRIAHVIARIKQDFAAPVSVAELAKVAGMSPSSFHAHFKSITSTTPLQYQKGLRLLEARRLLTEEGYSVSHAAFSVGYESPTQFSREYSRTFGATPRDDKSRDA